MIASTVAVLGLALLLGVVANSRYRRWSARLGVEPAKPDLLVSTLLTLTALLLAFVLVQVFSSYQRARIGAGDEASRVMTEFRLFGLLPGDAAERGQASLLCYSRAVVEVEWPALRNGMALAPEPSHWADEIAGELRELAEVRNGQPFGALLSTDGTRLDARRRRVLENRPAVPRALSWLMLGVSAVAVFSIATFTLGGEVRQVQVGALVLLTAVFASVQIAIFETDGKFGGLIRVEPDELRLVLGLMEGALEGAEIPCDDQGRPL